MVDTKQLALGKCFMKKAILVFLFASLCSWAVGISEVAEGKLDARDAVDFRLSSVDWDARVEAFGEQVAYSILPRYPSELRRAGIAGGATIDLVVDADGKVTSAAVLHASCRDFGDEALCAVREWRFVPGREVGEAGPRQIRVSVHFMLVGPA